MLKQAITSTLSRLQEPHLGTDLISAGVVKDIQITPPQVSIELVLGFPCKRVEADIKAQIKTQLVQALRAAEGLESIDQVDVKIKTRIQSHAIGQGLKGLRGVKNIIAIASGKGGVGKSTTAANLAGALFLEGARVGLLDADIYGPSQALMLGATSRPAVKDKKYLSPVICHGIQTMSIAYLIETDDTPMVWRGPMVTSALRQLLEDTLWDELDYLIIDLPPGTGDIQLTLAQKIPVSGALIVTTPQDLALLDARKGLRMFQKVKIPILGIIENMSHYVCSACGHEAPVFGTGGGGCLLLNNMGLNYWAACL